MFKVVNPIYDVYFKYLMQDQKTAACLLSAILEEDIQLLEMLPQERSVRHTGGREDWNVVRFDYRATIRQQDGALKKILIELQKVFEKPDTGRFRRYLGENYINPDIINGETLHLPITTIYLLGFQLGLHSPVIRRGGRYIDAITKETVEGTDAFIEALTHDAYFVQIPRLTPKHQTRLERVLSLFSQDFIIDPRNHRILGIPEEMKNEDNALLIERLGMAVSDPDLQRMAQDEESWTEALDKQFHEKFVQGKAEGIAEGKRRIVQTMKSKGLSVIEIVQLTGLTEEEIAGL